VRVTMEFDLPEEREELNSALTDYRAGLVLWDLDEWLRRKPKYEELPEKEDAIYDTVRMLLHELCDAHDYNLMR